MRKIRFVLLLLSAIVMFSCKDDSTEKTNYNYEETIVNLIPKKTPIKLTDRQKSLVESCNEFAFNYLRLSDVSDKSSLISPLSVTFILGMLNDGADGITSEEIMQVLGLSHTDKTLLNEFCANMIENAPKVDPNVNINISNGIFMNEDLELSEPFLDDMQKYYKAEVQSVDFSESSAKQILNSWVLKQTGGKINDVMGGTDSPLVSCWLNVTNFNATWTDHFDPKDTKVSPFEKHNGDTVYIPMMHRKALCLYGETPLYSAVCLPYSSGAYCMYILLPSAGVSTADVISDLTNSTWNSLNEQMVEDKGKMLDMSIPRFTSSFEVDLIDMLKNLGMNKAFTKEAEFPYISTEGLFVSKMKQLSTINVDEQGTKTATVSVAETYYTAPETIPFHANRPFVYLIQEKTSGAIFFMGTYMGD